MIHFFKSRTAIEIASLDKNDLFISHNHQGRSNPIARRPGLVISEVGEVKIYLSVAHGQLDCPSTCPELLSLRCQKVLFPVNSCYLLPVKVVICGKYKNLNKIRKI